jgi:hypothetical protein
MARRARPQDAQDGSGAIAGRSVPPALVLRIGMHAEQQALGRVEVLSHRQARALAVAFGDRGEHTPVMRRRADQGLGLPRHRIQQVCDLGSHLGDTRDEPRRARDMGEQDMEAPVGGAEEVVGLRRRVGLATLDHGSQLGDLGLARALRGELRGAELETPPIGEKVAHAVAVQGEHARSRACRELLCHEHAAAAAAAGLEVAGVVEQAQGLAHRRA